MNNTPSVTHPEWFGHSGGDGDADADQHDGRLHGEAEPDQGSGGHATEQDRARGTTHGGRGHGAHTAYSGRGYRDPGHAEGHG